MQIIDSTDFDLHSFYKLLFERYMICYRKHLPILILQLNV